MRDARSMMTHSRIFERNITLVPSGGLESVVEQLSSAKNNFSFFCNVHMLMLSQTDKVLATAMDHADFVFADGVPVAWLQKRLSNQANRVVRGHEVMSALCGQAAQDGKPIGLLGSTDRVLDALTIQLQAEHPGLHIALAKSLPFVDGELESSADEIAIINNAGLSWLFVSLGCPKQEKWIERHGVLLNCSALAVGAAFDWLAGTTPRPPRWMERAGLGWLFRLLQNPRKMWSRYLIYNTQFVLKVGRLLLLGKK